MASGGDRVIASGGTADAWSDAESAYGVSRGAGGGDPNDAVFIDADAERSIVAGLASSKGVSAADRGKIGIDPRYASQAQNDDQPVSRPRAEKVTQPTTIYDPTKRPDLRKRLHLDNVDEHGNLIPDPEPTRKSAKKKDDLDPADAEFFDLEGPNGTVSDEGSGIFLDDAGHVTMPQDTYNKHQRELAANEVEIREARQQKADMQAALNLMKTNPLGTMRALGVSDDVIQSQMQQMGLAAPAVPAEPNRAASDLVLPEFDEDVDPAVKALGSMTQATSARLQQLEGTLSQFIDRLEQKDRVREQRDYARDRAGRLSGVKGYLVDIARKVPALKAHGHGPMLVENVMHRLERDFDRLPSDAKELNEHALGMLRSSAKDLGLSPSVRARKAKAASRRQAAPIPTTPGRVLLEQPPQGEGEGQFDHSNEDQRRARGLQWLEAEFRRAQES